MDKDELIAGAAHDIANALSAVLGWVELARRGADTNEALSAIEAAARAARTTAQLVLGEEDDADVTDAGLVARNVVRLLAPEATRRGVRVHLHGPSSAFVAMSPAACFRALWNVALNAAQAARSSVHLEITIDGDDTCIEVRDDGPGMDAETQKRVLSGRVYDASRRPRHRSRRHSRAARRRRGRATSLEQRQWDELCADRAERPLPAPEVDERRPASHRRGARLGRRG